MGVRIADGDSIAYWQTVNRDDFDGGPFIIRGHPPQPKPAPRQEVIVTLALPAPSQDMSGSTKTQLDD